MSSKLYTRYSPGVLLLYPERRDISPELLASGLRLGERAPPERPYLVLNMVSTLDGKATIEWRTKGLSTELDRRLFHQLRTQVDAVMVGAGTARAERYGRIAKSDELREKRVSEGLAREPLAIVASAGLNLPADLPLLQEPDQQVVIATASEAELRGTEARIDYLRTGDDLPLLMARLRDERGVRSILCEGGPTLNFHLLAAGLVDELFLTLNPKLSGGAAALTIVAGRDLVEPAELDLVSVAEGGGNLFTRWRIRS
jgi:riboflavin-specific deaminase-like protein